MTSTTLQDQMNAEAEKGIEGGNENLAPSHASLPDVRVSSNLKQEDEDQCGSVSGPVNGTEDVLETPLSTTRSRASYVDPAPPPDGGVRAWTQVFGSHLLVCNTWGFINSFGVFQTYYVGALGHPPSDISWIGSTQIWLLFFIGTFSGRATDYGLYKPTIALGSFVMIFGVFMTSLSTT